MPRGRPKKKVVPQSETKQDLKQDLVELITQITELREDNKTLAEVGRRLRDFNKDLVRDNIDSAQAIHRLEWELDELRKENEILRANNKWRILERICILSIILLGAWLMLLGIFGK